MAFDNNIIIGVILALLLAVIYSLRRVYLLEYKIIAVDLKIERILEHVGKKKR